MSADDLIRLVTDALFAVVFVAAAARALRDRRRAAVDAALMYGGLAFVIVEGEIVRALGVTLPPVAGQVLIGVLLAVPYFFLRLVDDLTEVPPLTLRVGLAGFALSWAAVLTAPQPLPGALTLAIVGYFGVVEIYGAVLLIRESLRTTAVPRRRAQAAAIGSLLLGLTLLLAGFGDLLPFRESVTRLLVLGSAISYVTAISPPALLKRAWLEPQLRIFLARASSISPRDGAEQIARELERQVAVTLGATRAVIAVRGDGGDLALASLPDEIGRPLSDAYAQQRQVLSTAGNTPRSGAVLAAPMTTKGRRVGSLAIEMRRAPLFAEDDLALLALLADQCALVLDGARLYADLAAANTQLEEATRAKSEFLANMSHELRTPLNAVLGFSDLLVEQLPQLSAAQQRYFRNIRDAGTHLLQLINEVLDLSKVEAGRLDLRPEPVRLQTLLEPVVAATRESAAGAALGFQAHYPAGAVVRVDPGRSRQILYNLLSNAVKFTPPGGTVVLRVTVEARDLVLDVQDSGIGIPSDKRPRVFGTFERLHEGRSEVAGTGLGLALTKRLVELHGGTIGFDSVEGRGTTFHVRIPEVSYVAVTGPRLLIVEDDQRDAELLAALASGVGVATEIVNTAGAARDAVRRDAPVGIVLDLRLPDERGDRFLEELKSTSETRGIAVLVVSVEDDEGRSRSLGADDHLTKPIDRERVSAWMRATVPLPVPVRSDRVPA